MNGNCRRLSQYLCCGHCPAGRNRRSRVALYRPALSSERTCGADSGCFLLMLLFLTGRLQRKPERKYRAMRRVMVAKANVALASFHNVACEPESQPRADAAF